MIDDEAGWLNDRRFAPSHSGVGETRLSIAAGGSLPYAL